MGALDDYDHLIRNLKDQLKIVTEQRDEARAEIEAIFTNCKVVFYPTGERMMEYPIEHNLSANKDMREHIEMELRKLQFLEEKTND